MAGITRQFCFGINPETGEANLYAWEDVPDGNSTGKAFTCGVIPPSKGAGINAFQETAFLGTTSGVGKTFQTFMDGIAMDGSQPIVSTAITHRIDPDARDDGPYGKATTLKRYENIQWAGKNPAEYGATVSYAKNSDPATDASVTWTEFAGNAADSILTFVKGLAQWMNLKITDSSININTVILPPFGVNYTTVGDQRDIRES